jgi:septum site-determining protein MinD
MGTLVIGVISGKGGVGKTTTTANLSAALGLLKKRVLAVDCNPGSPDLSIHLGLYRRPMRASGKGIISLPYGIDLMQAGAYEKKGRQITRRLLRRLGYDFIILDGPPVNYDRVLDLSDSVLVVTNPEVTAAADAIRAVKRAAQRRVQVAGIVLNCIRGWGDRSFRLSLPRLLEAPLLAVIPESPRINACVADGTPVVRRYTNCGASIEFKRLAARLAGVRYEVGFFQRITGKLYK